MIIYVTHSRNTNFKDELYDPLRNSRINNNHTIILPHELSDEPYKSRDLLLKNNCNLVLPEISQAATGQGIELGWADASAIPIICLYKQGSKLSGSLKVVSKVFIEYTDPADMISKIDEALQKYE